MSFDVRIDFEFLSSYRSLCVPRRALGVNLFRERERERGGRGKEGGAMCVVRSARVHSP